MQQDDDNNNGTEHRVGLLSVRKTARVIGHAQDIRYY
jgi:hypothetical protein